MAATLARQILQHAAGAVIGAYAWIPDAWGNMVGMWRETLSSEPVPPPQRPIPVIAIGEPPPKVPAARRWREAAFALGMDAGEAYRRAWTEIRSAEDWPARPR